MGRVQIDAEGIAEEFFDFAGFVVAEQSVVDKDAVKLRADRLMEQRGYDG